MTSDTADAPPTVSDPAERLAWRSVIWRALKRFDSDQMTHHAAAMTYYAMLSLFPGLLLGVSLLAVFGQQSTVDQITAYLTRNGASESVTAPIDALLRNAVVSSSSTISTALVFALVISLYGASGAFAASRRALNVVYGVSEQRGFVHRKLSDIGSTLVLIAMALVGLILVFLGGGLANDLFDAIGLGGDPQRVYAVVRWPLAFLVMLLAFAYVYEVSPDVEVRRFRPVTVGGFTAVLLWIIASFGFFSYLSSLGSLRSYGTFASAIVLLLWLWLTHCALLLGAELNASIEQARSAGRGGPPAVTPPPGAQGPDPRRRGG